MLGAQNRDVEDAPPTIQHSMRPSCCSEDRPNFTAILQLAGDCIHDAIASHSQGSYASVQSHNYPALFVLPLIPSTQ